MGLGQQPTKLWPPTTSSQGREIGHEPVSPPVHDGGLAKDQGEVRTRDDHEGAQDIVVTDHTDQQDRGTDQAVGETPPHLGQHLKMAT